MGLGSVIKKTLAAIGNKVKGVFKSVGDKAKAVEAFIHKARPLPLSAMTPKEKTFAKIAQAAYKVKGLRPANIDGYRYQRPYSDLKTAVYKADDGRIAFSIRGTDFSNKEDVSDDGVIVAGADLRGTDRFRKTLADFKKVQGEIGKNIIITGHSLGGTLGIELGRATNTPAIVFNPGTAPVKKQVGGRGLQVLKISGDPLSFSPTPGSVRVFQGKPGVIPHLISNFT